MRGFCSHCCCGNEKAGCVVPTVRTCAVLGRSRVTMHSRLPVLAESKRDRNGLVGCLRLRALRGDVVVDVCRLVPAWRW